MGSALIEYFIAVINIGSPPERDFEVEKKWRLEHPEEYEARVKEVLEQYYDD